MDRITVKNTGNYPEIIGAGLIGDIANKRYADIWVHSNWPQFPSVGDMLIDILVEDYNERHATDLSSERKTSQKASPVAHKEAKDG